MDTPKAPEPRSLPLHPQDQNRLSETILFWKPQGRAKDHAVRKGVKAFSDALLDLLVDTEETRRHVKDLWGKQELLYLGPDEQVGFDRPRTYIHARKKI